MTIVLYDLASRDDLRFSPNCWRTRLALAHKGLAADAVPTRFTEIADICGGGQKTIPVIEDGDSTVADSWQIANYLEETYADAPSLFGGAAGREYARFVQAWVQSQIHTRLARLIIKDVHDILTPEDQGYFRESRERAFRRSLEEIHAARDAHVDDLRRALTPVRQVIESQPFLGGEAPLYPDYLVFSALQWGRTTGSLALMADDDPLNAWVERCLDLHGGLARSAPARAT